MDFPYVFLPIGESTIFVIYILARCSIVYSESSWETQDDRRALLGSYQAIGLHMFAHGVCGFK